jgi:hypothetical protein
MVMNERIQNLKDKIWTEEYWTNPNTDKLLPAQLNKFAELIVQECVGVCESMQLIGPYKEVQDATLKDAVVQIKEHFGVEE